MKKNKEEPNNSQKSRAGDVHHAEADAPITMIKSFLSFSHRSQLPYPLPCALSPIHAGIALKVTIVYGPGLEDNFYHQT